MDNRRDLRQDLELCQKATAGPWKPFRDTFEPAIYTKLEDGCRGVCIARLEGLHGERQRNDANFIAAARTGWPEAIERAIKAEEENDLQRHSIQQLSAQVAGMGDVLAKTLPIIGELAESIGYGYYKPEDPRDFTPDFECCSKTEISNWKNDCAKADAGKEIGDIRVWGIGTYKIKDPEMIELRDKIKTILSSPDPGAEIMERMRKLEAVAEAARDYREHEYLASTDKWHEVIDRLDKSLDALEAVTPCAT